MEICTRPEECSHKDHYHTKLVLRKNFPNVTVKETIEFFENNGGYCDCEVILNVIVPDLEEKGIFGHVDQFGNPIEEGLLLIQQDICIICSKKLKTRKRLKLHMKDVHKIRWSLTRYMGKKL